ncbi:single-stranded DNA-binding protein [Tsukamurella sputi]|uniref:Single-stranded DNA-binding protein n=1 Tax=Tsukamurella sputi TaxID=2591848 RepID=A0A5C5RQV3_9ACTN|nr:single-stranded DNA-binding protein [Tsukamurella sputi]TWS25377.1 single-stranded DNA-binding protein [Tsukamurella sputi]
MSNTITIEGRATAPAELRFVASTGKAVATFTVADDYGHRDRQTNEWIKDGVTFLRVEVWDYLAEACAEKIGKGTKVTVTGALRQREYEHNGEKRTAYEIKNVSQVALPLDRFKPREQQGSGGQYQRPSQQDDPWGSAPAGDFGSSDSNIPF